MRDLQHRPFESRAWNVPLKAAVGGQIVDGLKFEVAALLAKKAVIGPGYLAFIGSVTAWGPDLYRPGGEEHVPTGVVVE